MLRNQWYVVLESKELGTGPSGFVRMGERLVFWRDEAGRPVCHLDKCAHRGASLALGKVLRAAREGEAGGPAGDECRIRCPFHGLEYDPSGRCSRIPANGRDAPVPAGFRLRTYPTYEKQGFIWIYWAKDGSVPAAPPEFFEDFGPELSWSTRRDPWDNHYSRSIENQLDVAHLPFVHHNTIGRGNRTLVEGPGILERRGGFFVFVYNKADEGERPRTSEEVPVPRSDSSQKLEFIFPNLWQNYITEKLRILAAFVPVEEGKTLVYLRFCQSFMRFPLIKGLVHAVGDRMNLVIAHQDRRIVNSQLPKGDGTGAGELLFPGDRAIMEYRKMRIEAAKALAAGR
jgi:phenylpropionate dioxygenase-like ring-hydroxylating dioxygenase large terminal subunit